MWIELARVRYNRMIGGYSGTWICDNLFFGQRICDREISPINEQKKLKLNK